MTFGSGQYKANFSEYDNPVVNRLIDRALAEPDRARRAALWGQIDQRITRDAPTPDTPSAHGGPQRRGDGGEDDRLEQTRMAALANRERTPRGPSVLELRETAGG